MFLPERIKNLKRMKRTSLRFRVTVAIIFMSIVPGLALTFLFYHNMEDFYKEKIQIYQKNLLDQMTSQMDNIMDQSKVASNQVLGLAVTSFDNSADLNLYQKLIRKREIETQLSNIRLANESIDNIYLIGFNQDYYTSNYDWNREKFLELPWTKIDINQEGRSITIPTHKADYKYLNPSKYASDVISLVTYLNRVNENSLIGFAQIDINYNTIAKAMSVMKMSETDFAYIIDADENIIYSPDKELIGKTGKNQTIRSAKIEGTEWSIIQVNSDTMLKGELTKARNIWFFFCVICLLAAILLAISLSHGITKPVLKIIKSMKKVSSGNFNTKVEIIEDKDLAVLADSFNLMVSEVEKLMKENVQKENERITMELTALNAQINSHFLYNTLNTIKWMAIRQGATEIVRMIVALVNMLEYSCKNTDKPVLISEEIKFIEDYVFVQQVRCNNNASVIFALDENLRSCKILKMLLQPIVENAMLHGFSDRNEGNEIKISARKGKGKIQITISDNGKGFAYDSMDKLTGVGLHNIQERLRLNYGEDYHIILESKVDSGTCVVVEIPIIEEVKDINAENINC